MVSPIEAFLSAKELVLNVILLTNGFLQSNIIYSKVKVDGNPSNSLWGEGKNKKSEVDDTSFYYDVKDFPPSSIKPLTYQNPTSSAE